MKTMKRNVFSALLAVLLVMTMLPMGVLAKSTERADKAPTPVKAASKNETSKETAKNETKKSSVDPFKIEAKDTSALYKMINGKFIVSPVLTTQENNALFFKAIASLKDNKDIKKLTWEHDEAAKSNEGSFFLVLKNGERVIFSLNQNNRIQAGEDYYEIPAETYTALKTVYDTDYNAPQFAQWLIHMMPSKITGVSVYNNGSFMAVGKEDVAKAVQSIRGIRVQSGDQHYPARVDMHREANAFSFKLLFGNETDSPDYTIVVHGDNLYIISSELRFNTEYVLPAGEGQRIQNAINALVSGEVPSAPPVSQPPQTPGSELLVTPKA